MAGVFETLLGFGDGVVTNFVTDTAATVAGELVTFGTTLLTIYVVLWGWSMMRGIIQEPVTDGFLRIVKIAGIFYLATSSSLFSQYVSDALFNWPTQLASTMQGAAAPDPVTMLDQMLEKGNLLGAQAWEKGSIRNMGAYFLSIIVFALTWGTLGITAMVIIMAKISLAISLAIGPFFFLALLFEPTKRWFDGWLSAVITEGIAIVFTVLAATMSFKLMNATYDVVASSTAANDGIVTMTAITSLVIYGIACAFVVKKMPVLAGSIGGAMLTGSASPLGWAYDKIRGATPAALRMGKRAGQAGYRGLRGAAGRFGRGSEGGSVSGGRSTAGQPGAVYRKITSSSRRTRAA